MSRGRTHKFDHALEVASVEEAFRRCDKDKSGHVTRIELMAGLWGKDGEPARRALGLKDNFTGEDIKALFHAVGAGKAITLEQLLSHQPHQGHGWNLLRQVAGNGNRIRRSGTDEVQARVAFVRVIRAFQRTVTRNSSKGFVAASTFEELDEKPAVLYHGPRNGTQISFMVEPEELPKNVAKFAFRPWVTLLATLALVPAALLVSGVIPLKL